MPLIQNAIFIPEDDLYLVSSHVHDFVTWRGRDGVEFSIDGGCAYSRVVGDMSLLSSGRIVNWCLEEDEPFEIIAAKLLWGSRGRKGDKPLTYRPLMELTLSHLRAIRRTQPQIVGTIHEHVVRYWIEQKEEEVKMRRAEKIAAKRGKAVNP